MSTIEIRFPHAVTIPVEETWNLEAIFTDTVSWQVEFDTVRGIIPSLSEFSGRFLASSEALLECLTRCYTTLERVARLRSYVELRLYGDTADATAKRLYELASILSAEYSSAVAFFEPEVLDTPPGYVASLINSSEKLAVYRHCFHEIECWRPLYLRSRLRAVIGEIATSIRYAGRYAHHDSRRGDAIS